MLREGKGGGAAADDDVGNGDDEDDDEEEDDDVCCTWRPAVDATTVAAPGQGGRQRCTAGRTRGRRKGAPAGWARKASRDRAMATAARGAQLGVHTSWMMGVDRELACGHGPSPLGAAGGRARDARSRTAVDTRWCPQEQSFRTHAPCSVSVTEQ